MSDVNARVPVASRRASRGFPATLLSLVAAGGLLTVVACGGGGSSSPPAPGPSVIATPTASPTSTPTAKPTTAPGQIAVTPASLSFTAVGAAEAQNVTLAQSVNASGYTVSACVARGVTVATAPATTTGTLTVTPVVAGTCTFIITGANGASASLPVTVTTTGVITQ